MFLWSFLLCELTGNYLKKFYFNNKNICCAYFLLFFFSFKELLHLTSSGHSRSLKRWTWLERTIIIRKYKPHHKNKMNYYCVLFIFFTICSTIMFLAPSTMANYIDVPPGECNFKQKWSISKYVLAFFYVFDVLIFNYNICIDVVGFYLPPTSKKKKFPKNSYYFESKREEKKSPTNG